MDTIDGLKSYRLSSEKIESLLQTEYGSSIQPLDHKKLQQLRKKQEQAAAMQRAFKARRAEGNQSEELELPEIDLIETELATDE